MTHASFVSRYSVIIVLLLAALNRLDIQCADVQNSYLNANPKERVYLYAEREFGKYLDKLGVVVRPLYGLKRSGIAWSESICQIMIDLGFQPFVGDDDVWIRSAVDTSEINYSDFPLNIYSKNLPAGERYWEYVFIRYEYFLVSS